jgi:hypothetical protein
MAAPPCPSATGSPRAVECGVLQFRSGGGALIGGGTERLVTAAEASVVQDGVLHNRRGGEGTAGLAEQSELAGRSWLRRLASGFTFPVDR